MSILSQISIIRTKNALHLRSPQSPSNRAHFRVFGGTWNDRTQRWTFRVSPEIEIMIAELFGPKSPTVKVRVPRDKVEPCGCEWKIGGYVIATWANSRATTVFYPVGVQRYKGPGGVLFHVAVRCSFAQQARLKIVESPMLELAVIELPAARNLAGM